MLDEGLERWAHEECNQELAARPEIGMSTRHVQEDVAAASETSELTDDTLFESACR